MKDDGNGLKSVDRSSSARIVSVDQFRGFAIVSMIMVNYLAIFDAAPHWLKHAPGEGFTFADLVAPYFVFAMGLMYARSYHSRAGRFGLHQARIHFLRRYGLLVMIGAVMSAVGFGGVHIALHVSPETVARVAGKHDASSWAYSVLSWGVLQALGAAGIIALPFIRFSFRGRFFAGCLLLIGYHVIFKLMGSGWVLRFAHGGPLGALAWAALLLFSTVLSEGFNFQRKSKAVFLFLTFGIFLSVGGFCLAKLLPLAKSLVSAPYVLVSAGISSLTFLAFFLIVDCTRFRFPHLNVFGRNALIIYIVHEIFVALTGSIVDHSACRVRVVLGAFCVYLACYLLACLLNRRSVYLKL